MCLIRKFTVHLCCVVGLPLVSILVTLPQLTTCLVSQPAIMSRVLDDQRAKRVALFYMVTSSMCGSTGAKFHKLVNRPYTLVDIGEDGINCLVGKYCPFYGVDVIVVVIHYLLTEGEEVLVHSSGFQAVEVTEKLALHKYFGYLGHLIHQASG